MTQYGHFLMIVLLWTGSSDIHIGQERPSVTKMNMESSLRYSNETHWLNIRMPTVSYWDTMGFPAPTDEVVWEMAKKQAMTGQQILLAEVLNTIHSPGDILSGDIKFRRLKKLVDIEVSEKEGGFGKMKQHMSRSGCCHGRSPVTLLGSGEIVKGMMSVKTVVKMLRKHATQVNNSLPDEGIVALGSTDENWGWLSTHFLNRTASWEFEFAQPESPLRLPMNGQLKDIAQFLDHPKLVILVVNQHNNITHLHPKTISMPRGMLFQSAKEIWAQGHSALATNRKINTLMLTASSNWGPRPYIVECVKGHMEEHLRTAQGRGLSHHEYVRAAIDSASVLCVPGLGYDTFRVFETLFSGAMPVLERSIGLDRSWHKLPVLQLDDFYEVTPAVVRQAYVEALYHAHFHRWDYRRLTQAWWEALIFDSSVARNASILLERHPLPKFREGVPFSRPMIPFQCPSTGCGKGTHRTPLRSCAIDTKRNLLTQYYNWMWEQGGKW